ncbi:MAG: YjgN family protein [Alphaproteobacteria bacterium]
MTEETALSFEENETPTQTTSKITPKKTKKNSGEHLSYDGQIGALYKLFILDFFMRIITLGIYSFWGKTRLRKYIASCYSLGEDRFEYTGTGGELFKGFLKVLPIIVILFAPVAFAEFYPILALFYIPIIYCFGIAIYGAARYRYSRTRWRGIRGYVGGSTIGYANLSFGRLFLNIITLGFAIPSSDIKKHKYIMDNTYFGSVNAEFNGNSRVLMGAHIKSLIFLVLPGIFFAIPMIMVAMIETMDPNALTISPGLIAATSYILAIFSTVIGIPIGRSIYGSALMREKMRGLQIGSLKFMCTITTMDLIKHKLMNGLILIITLGFGYPMIVNRNMKLMARHHIIMGDLEAFEATQAKDQEITSGEGLEGALDLDTGFI